eukprot:m.1633795 g.1633795  ORF g.1633795 m.1633795 type:complete len:4492 (+) comp25411_c0_seq1:204-13679(+)
MGDWEDPRATWMSEYVKKSLCKNKADKWKKLESDEERRTKIIDWWEKKEDRLLVIQLDQKGQLEPVFEFPASTKTKAVYFIKPEEMVVAKENVHKLLRGDMSYAVIDALSAMIDGFFLPAVSNPNNNAQWPKVVSTDVHGQLQKLKNSAAVVNGQIQGKTQLPLPEGAADANGHGHSADTAVGQLTLHNFESTVIDWAHQILNVLKHDSAQPLIDGKNPGPLVELNFWMAKEANVAYLAEQLNSEKVNNIQSVLEAHGSSYAPTLAQLRADVNTALEECKDITMFLEPIRPLFEELEETEFEQLPKLVAQIMHCVGLTWKHSAHFSTPRRIVVLLREFFNELINCLHGYVEPRSVFGIEPLEFVAKLTTANRVIDEILDAYHHSRSQLNESIDTGASERAGSSEPWTFENALVLGRFLSYRDRTRLISGVGDVRVDFEKLEKIELSGADSRANVMAMNEQFNEWYASWVSRTGEEAEGCYDPLDPTEEKFTTDLGEFYKLVRDLDLRLGAVAQNTFSAQVSLEGFFRVILIFQGLLERPTIQKVVAGNFDRMTELFRVELEAVRAFHNNRVAAGDAQHPKNMPSVAGELEVSRQLRKRIENFFTQLQGLQKDGFAAFSSVEAQACYRMHHEMLALLEEADTKVFEAWATSVGDQSNANLNRPLLVRHAENRHISINFDPQLVAVLREVKYLELQETNPEKMPESAQAVYARNETFRQWLGNLGIATAEYNRIQATLLDVEAPLIMRELTGIDDTVEAAVARMNWNDDGVGEYCVSLKEQIEDLSNRLIKTKANVDDIFAELESFYKTSLLVRDEKSGLLPYTDRARRLEKTYALITAAAEKFDRLIRENANAFRADKESDIWRGYLEYLDAMIFDGLFNVVFTSMSYVLDAMADDGVPLLAGVLNLHVPNCTFAPSMLTEGEYEGKSLLDWIREYTADFFKVGSLIPRVATHLDHADYQNELMAAAELVELKDELEYRAQAVMAKALDHQEAFLQEYQSLWMDSIEEFMDEFVKYNHVRTPAELEAWAEEHEGEPFPEDKPTLTHFKDAIDKYDAIAAKVEQIADTVVFESWYRVDLRPFRASLLKVTKSWSNTFVNHLKDHVTNTLVELEDFVSKATEGLSQEIPEGDYDALVSVMSFLNEVSDRDAHSSDMFGPLNETVELLSAYEVELPDEILGKLSQLPDKWSKTKRLASQVTSDCAPAQADETVKLRRKANQFDVKNFEFREDFLKRAPLRFDSENPYARIDAHYAEYMDMQAEMMALEERSTLFKVQLPEYKQVRACGRELVYLKHLWDLIGMVNCVLDSWAATLWQEVNVEDMEMECKKFIKDIRNLNKETRAWEAFNGIDSQVKNMVTSLGAVGLLQSSAIRDRHWQQVMATTGVKIEMSDSTCLRDLLALNLHEYEDDVAGIVDKASKELQMEKMLDELQETWSQMTFEFDSHKRTQLPQVKVSEEMIETLEDNQVQLQNQLASKYIAFFQTEVSSWSKKLATADQVIEIWLEVQRTWGNLESIFIGSEDIRSQLPEDALRFDGIDADFRELVTRSATITNVVECTNQDKMFEKLESMQDRLAVCEKALQEYLDTKRLAFPRFYFVSSADLLDILSNGNNPEVVAKQLSKLFGAICDLKMEPGTKKALGMLAADSGGEYVEFRSGDGPGYICECEGRVEDWLNKVLTTMQETIRWNMRDSFQAYEEKPRDQWVFDWPAQVALVGTQVYWTSEVNQSFAKLEEGFENAMKDYNKKQVNELNALITLLQGKLSKAHRVMLQTVCTVDVHSRDIVIGLIREKADNAGAFIWQSQLRHFWDDSINHCRIAICDARFIYSCEYLGNIPRLVITPLTDRCYITLTQALHLKMSGAPAGPAGTGKTETTKDLSRNIGIMIYVFNCSEQMDYKSTGNIYKGLAQSGAWGCFDEFNRISIEVLSVVAVQVKCVQDAIKAKKKIFNFLGETIRLNDRVGMWITMNPGYAGRTALPENIKALFRPCAMVVPDYGQICEIMLVSEGFLTAKMLGLKFITLYQLNRDLLSKQDHYDWGLRAIKSVLVVAGKLKRADPDRSEEEVLMRALRDFNVPKIVNEDLSIFLGLILDLFPGLDVPRKADAEFERKISEAITTRNLQPEDSFILKVVQLEELLEVRHSVFVLGPAATGKSAVLRALFDVYKLQGQKPVWTDLNPKACTNHELYGYINMATRDWVDGLFSSLMRDMANINTDHNKWLVLDGDIDTMWIESLNTVMDDNKILTLASNERIPLNPTMRMLFEIANLSYASPATVSRAGILFVNPTDLGWQPVIQSWIDQLESPGQRSNLMILFEKYVPTLLEAMRTRFKTITPIPEWTLINTLTTMLSLMLTEENTPEGCSKEDYELYFAWCAVWAFGGGLFKDQLTDWREEFSKWWVTEFKTIKFPSHGTVFDYYINTADKKWSSWADKVQKFEFDPEVPVSAAVVQTSETARLRFWMDLMLEAGKPMLFVGAPGTGKTATILDKLKSLDADDWVVQDTSFNNYTIHHTMQAVIEEPLEKKAGRNYGPPGTKRLVYFVDDLNMPEVDLYGTQSAHTIMRQMLDYNHFYDLVKKSLRVVSKTQFVGAMNPKAGSFTINPRLLRHFAVFAMSAPSNDALNTIYCSLFQGHMKAESFSNAVNKISATLVEAAVKLHDKVASNFLPTAVKFHYLFNLRDLTNIFQGMHFSQPDSFKTPISMVRLYMHEATRVYSDKLTDFADAEKFADFRNGVVKEAFPDLEADKVNEEPNIICHFAGGIGEPKYAPTKGWEELHAIMAEGLNNYNEMYAAMNLVLFRDAMEHVCRINRILESPRGNALLVGVGGSGKQSLSRLAASLSGLETFQIALTKGYGMNELKADLLNCFIKTGQKAIGVMFLMTDSQVADEKFLVLINDLLSSGNVPGLFGPDERDEVIDALRNEVKGAGLDDTNANVWKFFLDRVRRLLKVVLCFSPVGDTLRARARMFPAVVNCTSIDWFHDWPREALVSVSRQFLDDNELIPVPLKNSMADFMAEVHTSVNEISKVYLANEKRHNYTTPKSFLEQISLYQSLLEHKVGDIQRNMDRMENGLTKLRATAAQVDDMKEKLKAQEVELAEKNKAANELIEKVGIESAKGQKDRDFAAGEEKKVSQLSKEVGAKREDCERDLAKAEPALVAAAEALNSLNKNNLTELKSFASPPPICVEVVGAVMCLLAKNGKIPPQKSRDWKSCKSFMGNVGEFLTALKDYDKENIPDKSLKEVKEKYLVMEGFDAANVAGKSLAAAGLCSWVINIITFYEVYCDVAPKRAALAEATAQLEGANNKLAKIMAKIAELDAALNKLKAEFQEATDAKLACQAEADKTAKIIGLANRLVGGLASENVRWGEAVEKFKAQMVTIPGDTLITTAFLSYTGCFSKAYREVLMNEKWVPYLDKQDTKIPVTPDLDPLDLLTDGATIAGWQNDYLPADRVSTENATILTSAKRWPLIIDPQEQGIKWVKERSKSNLVVVRLGAKGYLDKIERAISDGSTLLIENIFEEVDAVLGDVIGRNTIKKGRAIMIGDKEVEYNKNFKLILHTKMGNPHYKPEMQAQCTLINFTVTQSGLEDQLLADVVGAERADLQEQKAALTKEQNEFMITLKELEDNLLAKLSSAEGNFLEDEALVIGLEDTKKTATEIAEKVELAKETEHNINTAREKYRPAAARGSLMYFILNVLEKLHPMYQISLKAFNVVFMFAVSSAAKDDDVDVRVKHIIDHVTFQVYQYTSRGLFERDKLIFATQAVFAIMRLRGELDEGELSFLLRSPGAPSPSPVDFLTASSWGSLRVLSQMEAFANLDRDIEGSAKRWQKFCEAEIPEREKLPGDWKGKSQMQQLCILRCLRPDRMMNAITIFIGEMLGERYVSSRSMEFSESYKETTKATGVFFILSAGVNPIAYVEDLGKKMGYTFDNGNYHMVSLGQGQEPIAEEAMKLGAKEGHWVVLENIHLVAKWLKTLEKTIEDCAANAHENFRFYLTAEPAATAASHIMPQGILQACIKITNEPPSGVKANLHEALGCFTQETLEMCAKENEFRKIMFALVYHHAVIIERRKFGPIGWNVNYPFNKGDLSQSVMVLFNYLESNSVVPWVDLRYIFGEIMYGGHITDNIDRRLESTYLEEYLKPEMLDVDIEFAPGFLSPPTSDYDEYHQYIDDQLPPESPYLYGLHPNAEIDYLTNTSARLFGEVLAMQGSASASGGGGKSRTEIIKETLEDFMEKLPEEFNSYELSQRVPPEERTPYINVAFQETNRMNRLLRAIRSSLRDVRLGLRGELTITPAMEAIESALFFDTVPPKWGVILGPSTKPLAAWFVDLLERVKGLEAWTADFALPSTVWLGGLFNPQAFLTAIAQQTARKNEWPLDKVVLQVDVTKKYNRDDFTSPPREGAYLSGLFMAGARWDTGTGLIQESRLKELCAPVPIIFCKAIPLEKQDLRGTYSCPTFKTVERGRAQEAVAVGLCPGFVWYFNLKTKVHPNKWVLAGCAMTLSD